MFMEIFRAAEAIYLGLRLVTVGTSALVAAVPAGAVSVAIEINNNPGDRGGYICWTPVAARARLVVDTNTSAASDVAITLKSDSDPGGGKARFQKDQGIRISRKTFSPGESLDLILPADGRWLSFWVMGAQPSHGTKDVRIVATGEHGNVLGSLPVMVRVRKNADKLTDFEEQIFVSALSKLHDVDNASANSEYSPFSRIHQAANQLEIHKSPLFLPWHRALVVDLERRLQDIDPRVAVPYWRFDLPANRVLSANFMGATEPGVPFSPGAGLARWIDPSLGRLLRDPPARPADGLLDPSIPDHFNDKFVIFSTQLESKFHSGAHNGVGGWLASAASPSDPLFFLLHSNVDRVWAHWQAKYNRFDPNDEQSYSSQGAYPGSGPDRGEHARGVYAGDEMWPWRSLGPTGAGDPYWPMANHPMPPGSISSGSPPPITPGGQVDYLDVAGNGLALGYCYDDISYLGEIIPILP
jgi:tyrosinase